MIIIDGSFGEGGGQILRTSLALSMVTGKPFRIESIRAGRKKPGLMRQHLTAARAAAEVSGGRLMGAEIGSTELAFEPGEVRSGEYSFAIGTAGSTTLVLQTVLPALLTASGPSEIVLEGGTHNTYAPPYDFLEKAFVPLVNRMGPCIEMVLERHGFYPAGGGRFRVRVTPADALRRMDLIEAGEVRSKRARAIVACLGESIARRELAVIGKRLGLSEEELVTEVVEDSCGPGNIVFVEIDSEHVTEVFTGFGQLGVKAEKVAEGAASRARRYMAAAVPVGRYLADQLLVPFAMAGGGAYRTVAPSEHTRTNAEVIGKFLDVNVAIEEEGKGAWRVEVKLR
ncbi:MAG: RNA 3'-terminal phosphate cyclase [Planctomycetota bacterium]|jgi:RNA 3'-terminal phosphate cyclase (ATP)